MNFQKLIKKDFFSDYFPTRTVPQYRGGVSKILISGQYIFPFKEFILNLRWIHVRNKLFRFGDDT